MKFKRILLSINLLLIVFVTVIVGHASVQKNDNLKQEARTVSYDEKAIDEETLFDGFDTHKVEREEDNLKVIAEKKFDKSFFEELDFVDLSDNQEKVSVNYEAKFIDEESTMYLSVIINDDNGENNIIEILPGLVTFNKLGDADVMFMDEEGEIWLSDLQNSDVINNTGFWNFIRKVINYAIEINPIREVVNKIAAICAPFIRIGTTTLYLRGYGSFAAWIGAQVLNMKQEYKVTKYNNGTEVSVPTGIYHANFNCWQKNVGYDDLYDEVFDNGTQVLGRKRMERHKYEIDIDPNANNGTDYILWAWKGDYYNLGAGCELGIYKKIYTSNFGLRWAIDTSKSFSCNLNLKYNNKEIINWNNDGNKHWWFTGFNSNYQYPVLWDVNDLKATFTVTFNSFNTQSENDAFFNDFYSKYTNYKYDNNEDWKYWNASKSSYVYYNGMKCYKATLSF